MDRTELQLRQHLTKREFPESAIEASVQRLLELDYLNDARYAAAFVRTKSEQLGVAQLRRKLATLGIAADLIESAIGEYLTVNQRDLALQLAQSRYRTMRNLAPEVAERRISGFLLRRGFTAPEVWSAIRQLKQSN